MISGYRSEPFTLIFYSEIDTQYFQRKLFRVKYKTMVTYLNLFFHNTHL